MLDGYTFCMFFKTGFCENTIFDAKYSWTREKSGNYYIFRGYQDTVLAHNTLLATWRLEIYGRSDIFATVNTTSYPLGTMNWEVHGDHGCEVGDGPQITTLNINSCKSNEYNCDDGTCVDIRLRCDGKID